MKLHTRRRVSTVITIVSLVDILTMVLMFFVYTTTFKTQQSQVIIDLPQVNHGGETPAPVSPVVLAIQPSGDVFLDEKPIAMDALGDAVKKLQSEQRPLEMKADTKANFGKVMAVLDVLKGAGVPNVPTLTQEDKK